MIHYQGKAVVVPGLRNKLIVASGRFTPRTWLTPISARWLRPADTASPPPIEVRNETVIRASAERAWDRLTDVDGWPLWYRACRWVRVEPPDGAAPSGGAVRGTSFRWKAHPVTLRSTGGGGRTTTPWHVRRRRPRPARRARLHLPALARRVGHRRRQPRDAGRASSHESGPALPGPEVARGQPGDVRRPGGSGRRCRMIELITPDELTPTPASSSTGPGLRTRSRGGRRWLTAS